MSRILCLYVPSFPAAARLRVEPGGLLAVMDGRGPSAKVTALGPDASRTGLSTGLTAAQARALAPTVRLRPRDLAAERSAQEALLETADESSPIVEDGGSGLAYCHLLSSDPTCHVERLMGERLIRRAAAAGLGVRVGVAATRAVARVAARLSEGGPLVVPPGEEAEFLAPLPLAALEPDGALAEKLKLWGLRTVGELAALPSGGLVRRLGREGADLRRAARGVDERPLVPRRRAETFAEGLALEWPVGDMAAFGLAAAGPLERLAARLASAGLACRRLTVELKLDDEAGAAALGGVGEGAAPRVDARAIELAAPTRDVKTLAGLVALELETRPPAAAIAALCFTAAPETLRAAQLSLFGPPSLSPDLVSTALARLSALLGPDRVGRALARDVHRPGECGMEAYELKEGGESSVGGQLAAAVRALRPAVELEVSVVEPDVPAWVRSEAGSGLDISGGVRTASGPWKVEEGWWSGEPVQRDYWDVELSDGAVYRIYQDLRERRWFADGVYD